MRIRMRALTALWVSAVVGHLGAQTSVIKELQSDTRRIEKLMVKGKTGEAAAAAESSIKKQEPTLSAPSSAAASLYGTAGAAELKAGDFGKAGQYLERAVETQEEVSASDAPAIVKWTRESGTAYDRAGDPAKAEAAYWRDVSLRMRLGDDRGKATTLAELAGFYSEHGDYDKALNVAKEAVSLTVRVSGAESDDSALALRRLGEAYGGKKDYANAQECYERALGILEKRYGKESLKILPALNDLGVLMRQNGDLQAAYRYFSRAYTIQSKAKKTPAEAPNILNNFASIYVNSNDLTQAKDLYEKALDVNPTMVKMLSDDVVVRNNLGVIYDQLGEKEKSKQQFDLTRPISPRVSAGLKNIVALNDAAVTGSPPPVPETVVQVQRYATVKAPPLVETGQDIEVSAALTENNQTPDVLVRPFAAKSVNGQLVLSLTAADAKRFWSIDVTISAPQFDLVGGEALQTVKLPRTGDSGAAVFRLRLKPDEVKLPLAKVIVTFEYNGVMLASAMRDITIKSDEAVAPRVESQPPANAPANQSSVPAVIDSARTAADLTLQFEDFPNGGCKLEIISPHLAPRPSVPCQPTASLAAWVSANFSEMLRNAGMSRTFKPAANAADFEVQKKNVFADFNGFGKQLYSKAAPPELQAAINEIRSKHRPLKRVAIYTSDPAIPWELMIIDQQHSPDGSGFLGTEAEVARWHLENTGQWLARPPDQVMLRELDGIAPHYQGSALLANQEVEFESIRPIPGFREVPGTFTAISDLLRNPPDGIVHFAGHGLVETVDGVPRFLIQLEGDATLSLRQWTGLVNAGEKHSLYFLNACDVGQAENVANFVQGWGPTVLESGGSGFIGGMWPLSDKGASDFASIFYTKLRESSKAGSVEIAELLRLARQRFAETGDPTYLGYVFYGDVGLKLVP